MTVPTRWRTAFEDQIADARRRLEAAERQLEQGDGGRALQAADPAGGAAAAGGAWAGGGGGARGGVWLADPPWHRGMAPTDMQRKVREALPGRFGALAVLDLRDVLTSPWTTDAAEPYVSEARAFVQETSTQLESWLGQG